MENPIKMDDLRVPLFLETPISQLFYTSFVFFFGGGVLLKYDQHTKLQVTGPGGKIPQIFRDPQ